MNEQRNMIMPKVLIVKDKEPIALSESRKLHGGRTGVQSAIGGGSKFRVELSTNKPLFKTKVEKRQGNNRSSGILIVEDNEAHMLLLSDLLSIYDYKISKAVNGREAVDLVQSFKPNLILMNINMPVMDGLEATRKIRTMQEFLYIPIIALTVNTGKKAREEQWAAGCTGHLAKPFNSEAVSNLINRYLL